MAEPVYIANRIVTKLSGITRRLKAIAVVDGPNDAKELEKFRDLNGHFRLFIVSPTIKVAEGAGVIDVPASSYIAGVFARIKVGQSPSNQLINGILGTTIPISFEIDDPETIAQQYAAMQVATVVRDDGFRVWGVRGSGDPDDIRTNQIQKVRVSDAIEEAITSGTRWAVAAGITRDFIGSVVRKIDNYFRALILDGSIVGGSCKSDKDLNTADALASGNVYWKYDFTPTAVAETLHFDGYNTNKYYADFGEG